MQHNIPRSLLNIYLVQYFAIAGTGTFYMKVLFGTGDTIQIAE
jgi:hypothetical protein